VARVPPALAPAPPALVPNDAVVLVVAPPALDVCPPRVALPPAALGLPPMALPPPTLVSVDEPLPPHPVVRNSTDRYSEDFAQLLIAASQCPDPSGGWGHRRPTSAIPLLQTSIVATRPRLLRLSEGTSARKGARIAASRMKSNRFRAAPTFQAAICLEVPWNPLVRVASGTLKIVVGAGAIPQSLGPVGRGTTMPDTSC
jgi:hypothetical protein